jgi:hypothetical protein
MAAIITRSGKGSALLNAEVDANFINLNSDKAENAITVQQTDIGTAPNEVPLNQYLGALAYQDRTAVNIGGGVATLSAATIASIQNDTAISNVEPSLMLNFAAVEALDPRITYSRASTATYYNGVTTAVAEQNLLLQSQTFDNASWTKTNGAVTADAIAAPDGTTTADLFTENTATGVHTLQASGSSIANQPMVFSAFIKPNGRTVVRLDWENNDSFYVLATLTGGGTINGGSGTVTALAGGWYRLALTTTPTLATSAFRIRLCESATGTGVTSYTGDGTSGIYVWGAQLEQRSAVTAYNVTTTQPITNYIPVLLTAASGVPRFDHNPISQESLGFLVEQQSTNLFTYSEDFSNAAWVKTEVTVSSDVVIAPNGTLTVDKVVSSVNNVQHRISRDVGATTGAITSIYAKAGGYSYVEIILTDTNNRAVYDLTNGSVLFTGSGITSATSTSVGNGWYRLTITSATQANHRYFSVVPKPTSSTSYFEAYAGNGFDGIYIWGAQLEAGAFATSYIATVASQVTRAVDSASMTGTNFSSWYSQGEGTLYVESLTQAISFSNNKNLQLNDGTLSNEIWLGSGSPGTSARSQISLGGTTYFDSSLTNQMTAGVFGKYAVSFETNNAVLCANGTLGTVDTAVVIPSSINLFSINLPQRAGYYKKIAYFPRRLSDAELQEMTS